MQAKRVKKVKIVLAFFTFGLFLLAFRDFFGAAMLAFGDPRPFPESADQTFKAFFSMATFGGVRVIYW